MYLIRLPGKRGRDSIVLTDEVHAVYAQHMRTKKILKSPIGNIREVEATRPNKGWFYLQAGRPRRADGSSSHSVNPMVEARQAAIQRVVKEVAQEDLDELVKFDERIEEAKQALYAVRREREEYVREQMWKRAEPVSIRTFYEQADEREEHRTY